MINAFGMDRHIATRHEQAIADVMLHKVRDRSLWACDAVHRAASTEYAAIWEERAVLIRDALVGKGYCLNSDIAQTIGLQGQKLASWMETIRKDADAHGIGFMFNETSKKYTYWAIY